MTENKVPLVSVLIPAYNRPDYLELALNSVLSQSYKNIEIIICDDSTTTEVEKKIKPYLDLYPQIKYIKNETRLGIKNYDKCYSLSQGEYINYLMDDDLFDRYKIQKMLKELENPKVKLVTSIKYVIDRNGELLDPPIYPRVQWIQQTQTIDGIELGNYALKNHTNCIGEPTTVLFRKKDLSHFRRFKRKAYTYLSDLASWLTLLSKGNAVILGEPLSSFRMHPEQMQKQRSVLLNGMSEWFQLIKDSRKKGFLKKPEEYNLALKKLYAHCKRLEKQGKELSYEEDVQTIALVKRKIRGELKKHKENGKQGENE